VGDDDAQFQPAEPDISFLQEQMARACVNVRLIDPQLDDSDTIGDIPFLHNIALDAFDAASNTIGAYRNVNNTDRYWHAYIVGAYEADEAWDYDGEANWHIGQSFRPVLILQEVIRDLSVVPVAQARADIERHIVLHEVLHRFYGPHHDPPQPMTDEGNMDALTTIVGTDAENVLSRLQLKGIQKKPNGPDS